MAAFYAALELFTNMVLETILYAGAMGVSQVALMVSVDFGRGSGDRSGC